MKKYSLLVATLIPIIIGLSVYLLAKDGSNQLVQSQDNTDKKVDVESLKSEIEQRANFSLTTGNSKKAVPINSAEAEKLFEAANRANSQIRYVGIEKSGLPASEIAKLKQNFANLNSKGSYSGGRITHEFANTTALKMALVKNGGLARMIAKLNFVPTDIGKVLGEDFKLVGADYSGALNEGKFNSIFRSYDSSDGKRLEINELYLTPDNDYSLEVYKESINFNLQGHLATLQQLKNADKDVYNLDFHVNKRAFSISAEGFSYAEFIDTSVAIAELANQAQN